MPALMEYIKLVIAVDDNYQENLIVELLNLDFDSFEQRTDKIISYIPKQNFSDVYRERIEQILVAYPGDGFIETEEVVADQNWNEQWEKTIVAQQIGSFFVRPTWSRESTPGDAILLEIDPKMAFGTGYHETTRLMLELLPGVISESDHVLDAGTGTGILAIASIKLGADKVLAFDIDDWSISNATENILLNDVADRIDIKKGSSEVIPEKAIFDIILSNINRNAILELLPEFKKRLKANACLLLSGLLETDKKTVTSSLEEHNFLVQQVIQENEWIAIQSVLSS